MGGANSIFLHCLPSELIIYSPFTQYGTPSFKPGWEEGPFLSSPVLSPNQVLTFYNLLSIVFSTVATIS